MGVEAQGGPQTRRTRALQQMPRRPTSLEGPSAHLHAQQTSPGLDLGAMLPRVTPCPLGPGPPKALAASVWEIR